MEKRWIYKEVGNEEDVQRLSEELSIDAYLSNLLVQRGVRTFDEAKAYFRPQLSDLHDPFLIRDMDKAVDRIAGQPEMML